MVVKGLSRPWRRPFAEYGVLLGSEIERLRECVAARVDVREPLDSWHRVVEEAETEASDQKLRDDSDGLSDNILATVSQIFIAEIGNNIDVRGILLQFWARWDGFISRTYEPRYPSNQSEYMYGRVMNDSFIIWQLDQLYPHGLVRPGTEKRALLAKSYLDDREMRSASTRLILASNLLEICILGGQFREGIDLFDLLVGPCRRIRPYDQTRPCYVNASDVLYWWCLLQLGEASDQTEQIHAKLASIFREAALQLVEDGPLTPMGLYSPSFWIPFWARLAGLEHDPWNAIRRFYYLDDD